MSFFGQACQGTIDILVNQWYHVGFVFNMNTMTQSIYLNGEINQLCAVVSPLTLVASTPTSIGYVPLLVPLTGTNFFHVSSTHDLSSPISQRTKQLVEQQLNCFGNLGFD